MGEILGEQTWAAIEQITKFLPELELVSLEEVVPGVFCFGPTKIPMIQK